VLPSEEPAGRNRKTAGIGREVSDRDRFDMKVYGEGNGRFGNTAGRNTGHGASCTFAST
jgi:hypothetical protein